MDATPWVALPDDAGRGIAQRPPAPMPIGTRAFSWGTRTYVMGIVNVTPDSFSGDGILGRGEPDFVERARQQAMSMIEEGADLIDVGGQSTRPGHDDIPVADEIARAVPVIEAIRAMAPDVPISIDTTRAEVAAAAVDAGADLINDIWGVAAERELLDLAARRNLPVVLMHNRAQARYTNVVAEVMADLSRALDAALEAGIAWEMTIVDPGIGFGKTAEHNLAVLHDLHLLSALGRPVLLGTSRKSTIGKVLDLPADQRVEGTMATTALGIAAGIDIVRVHDVQPNVRVARMSDAVVRGRWSEGQASR
jgi:dihydropteroate synthase